MSPSPSHDALTWVPAMLRLKPARLPIGHSLRSGITVGAPFVIGVLTGHVLIGMWIGLATLLLSAGEREGSHRLNLRILLISTPIAASAYLLGFIQHLPTAWLVLVMAALAVGSGIISGYGAAFSVRGMQFLLVAAIAIGVPGIDNWWQPIGWYVVGAAFYAALMAAETWFDAGDALTLGLATRMAEPVRPAPGAVRRDLWRGPLAGSAAACG